MKVSMRFEGGEELAAELSRLSTRLSKSLLRGALEMGAAPIQKHARAIAPRRAPAPDMADHIGVSTARTQEQAAVAIGPTRDFFYGFFQEVGTVHHGAHPFLRPAFETEAQKSLTAIGQELWRALAARGVSRSASVSVPVQSPGRLV